MDRVLREFFVGQWSGVLPWSRVVVYAAVVMVLVALTNASTLARAPRLTEDGHGMDSLSVAVNRSFCRVPSGLSSGDQIGKVFFKEPATTTQPVQQVIEARWGSIERYCASVTTPFINTENSLMLVESWAWSVGPKLSLLGIGRVLLAVKISLLVFFGIVFLRLGAAVLLCYAILDAAFALLGRLQQDFGYSTYSFLLCVVMATIALYPLMLSLRAPNRVQWLAWPAVAGVWSAFVVNMRTSYLPVCVGLALLYVCAVLLQSRDTRARAFQRFQYVAAATLVFAIGYAAFQYSFIARSRGAGTEFSYHTVFHPLVLSVGIPPTPFSQREGIEWNDGVGLTLAHRVDPSARYLSVEYERALASYYFSLWKQHPAEMIRVYLAKARLAGTEMIAVEDVTDWPVTFARRLLQGVPSGLQLLTLLVGGTAVAAWRFVRHRGAMLLLIAMMGTAATMLMIECMVIVPRYYLTYHAPLLLLYCSLTFVLAEAVVNGIARVVPDEMVHRWLR